MRIGTPPDGPRPPRCCEKQLIAAASHGTASTTGASKGPMRCLSSDYRRLSSFDRPLSHLLTERSTCFAEKASLSKVKTGRMRWHDEPAFDAHQTACPKTAQIRPHGAENELATGARKKTKSIKAAILLPERFHPFALAAASRPCNADKYYLYRG